MFREDANRFYRELGNIQIERHLELQEAKQFWQNILKQEIEHNENGQWIRESI